MIGVSSNSTILRSSLRFPFPFLEPSATGFSDLIGMLLSAVKCDGIMRVDANVALRAGSSKLELIRKQ